MDLQIPPRLRALLDGPEEAVCLAEAALLVAAGEYRDLDVSDYLGRLQTYADTVCARLEPDAATEERLSALNHYLFQELGFAPDADNFYDPRNSFLNEVLDRRRGIPISLSIVYIAVGRRLGLDLKGVSFPGHFLVKCQVDGGVVVLDPYHGGASLSLDDLQQRLRAARGGEVSRAIVSEMLVAAAPREVLLRMLRNLKGIYFKQSLWPAALGVLEWIIGVAPHQAEEIRDRGVVYEALECWRPAAADYEQYLALSPKATDADTVRDRAIEMRKRIALLN